MSTRRFERYGLCAFSLIMIACMYGPVKEKESIQRPAKVSSYIAKYKYLSSELHQKTGIPIPIIFAVAGLESNWGNSELAKKANNHFGIKTKEDWKGLTYCKETTEYVYGLPYEVNDCFRKYAFIRESYQDFGRFLKSRTHYQSVFSNQEWNLSAWAEDLQQGGYATDPDYAEKLIDLINRYRLDELK